MEFKAEAARLDALVARAARRRPGRTAIRIGGEAMTFGELDAAVTRCAAALRGLAGPPGAVVGLVSTLHPSFAVAYHGIARAGHIVAIINPLLREEGLRHVLALSRARAVVATPETGARIAGLRGDLPDLETVIPAGAGRLSAAGRIDPVPEDADLDDVVCLQFTSGTTGAAKGVRLTHRNLTVNAAQIAWAHGLDEESVTLNHLPNYHPMHLNSALHAAATQVLCAEPEGSAAVEAANAHGATHFYGLPVRLARLARDTRLAELRLATVRGVFSGGSALPVPAAERLSRHFGVPVVQGYGLAETSPLTHGDDPADPAPGSVGRPVPLTECRIVDVESRAVLPPGEKGEVQVRGPQLMAGYLGGGSGRDAGGWFSTGDLGRVDEAGRLHLIDRLKDVFKCDNWLVAPAGIERVALRHPAVRECVVFDRPHPLSGAVANAVVVLDDPDVPAEAVAEFVNEQVPYYERIDRITAVEAVPRSATGKIVRRELRDLIP
ncbi:class I adenylate-forming enzyme family protein [Actinomadura formosensis]|uniref:class I adenylate-forming enzyme family protein n=1 Tax=Actinomadura formosensis TaxID=60706 RepID=UPI000830BE2F|nr:AMP-binding protein [Actinomadura formosensis]